MEIDQNEFDTDQLKTFNYLKDRLDRIYDKKRELSDL